MTPIRPIFTQGNSQDLAQHIIKQFPVISIKGSVACNIILAYFDPPNYIFEACDETLASQADIYLHGFPHVPSLGK